MDPMCLGLKVVWSSVFAGKCTLIMAFEILFWIRGGNGPPEVVQLVGVVHWMEVLSSGLWIAVCGCF